MGECNKLAHNLRKMTKDRKFDGHIDEYGFPYLIVDLINPITNDVIMDKKAIIDTGAAFTHIKQNIIDSINLKATGNTEIKHLTDGNLKSELFKVNIVFNGLISVPNVETRLMIQPEYPSDLIIGLDIIKHCDFYYDSSNKRFSFSLFPSVQENLAD